VLWSCTGSAEVTPHHQARSTERMVHALGTHHRPQGSWISRTSNAIVAECIWSAGQAQQASARDQQARMTCATTLYFILHNAAAHLVSIRLLAHFSESSSNKQRTREGIVIWSDTATHALRVRVRINKECSGTFWGTNNRCKRKETSVGQRRRGSSKPRWHIQLGCSSTGAVGLLRARQRRSRRCRRTACC
jgi:hypothetical protein